MYDRCGCPIRHSCCDGPFYPRNPYFGCCPPCPPCPPCPTRGATLTLVKRDRATGATLSGAVFELAGGASGYKATSGIGGILQFPALAPGAYALREVQPPAGYRPDPQVRQVRVFADGTISLNGATGAQFPLYNDAVLTSPAPTIDALPAASAAVTGVGNPGCTVTVIFEDQRQSTASVDASGAWSAPVPAGLTLAAGDAVTAYQTCSGAQPSDTAVRVVDPQPATRTVTGAVYPVAFNDYGRGSAFLAQFDTVVELRTSLNAPAPASRTTIATPVGTDGSGSFTISDVPLGDYIVYIKRPGYLARTMAVAITSASPDPIPLKPPTQSRFILWGGDVNDDKVVNQQDRNLLDAAFGSSYGSPGYTPNADLIPDGEINGLDVSILEGSFGRTWADYPGAYTGP